MKYVAQIGDKQYTVDITHEDGKPKVSLDGKPSQVDLCEVSLGALYSLILNGNSYELWARQTVEGWEVFGGGRSFRLQLADERAHSIASLRRASQTKTEVVAVASPMPAQVVEVKVSPGQEVAKGEALIIVEAMKMENELTAPRAGKVREVLVEPEQGVEKKQTLIIIE